MIAGILVRSSLLLGLGWMVNNGIKNVITFQAFVTPRHNASEPSFHPAIEKLQIDHLVAELIELIDLFALALRASLAYYDLYFINSNRGLPPSVPTSLRQV